MKYSVDTYRLYQSEKRFAHTVRIHVRMKAPVLGLALLILYWKTRNIWACGLAHGLFDFFAGYTEGLFVPVGDSGSSYINTGEDGVRILITYFIIAAINVVLTFIVWKKVGKTIDFEKIRREW